MTRAVTRRPNRGSWPAGIVVGIAVGLAVVVLVAPRAFELFSPDPLTDGVRHHRLGDGTEFLSTHPSCHIEAPDVLRVRETTATVTLIYNDRGGDFCAAADCIGSGLSGEADPSRLPPSECDLSVRLESPLGDRTVIDAATGSEVEVRRPLPTTTDR